MVNDKSFIAPPFKRRNYYRLSPEFKIIVDHYYDHEHAGKLQEVTILRRACSGMSLFCYLQDRGITTLGATSEDVFVSYFIRDKKPIVSASHRYHLQAFLKTASENYSECHKLLSWMPYIRTVRKNIQYLTDEEAAAIKQVCVNEDSGLSYLERALGVILLFTGMRSSDIAALTIDSVDWERERLQLTQSKTGAPLELPMSCVVGNAIYDYLCNERPQSSQNNLLLSPSGRPLYSQLIASYMHHVYDAAEVRQSEGDRRGTHIFRHRVATKLLENEIPQPVISQAMGHLAPTSVQAYLNADIKHLRGCALSIEQFPVDWSVISHA